MPSTCEALGSTPSVCGGAKDAKCYGAIGKCNPYTSGGMLRRAAQLETGVLDEPALPLVATANKFHLDRIPLFCKKQANKGDSSLREM